MKKILVLTSISACFFVCPACTTTPTSDPATSSTPTADSLKSRIVVPSETEETAGSDLRSRIYVPSEG